MSPDQATNHCVHSGLGVLRLGVRCCCCRRLGAGVFRRRPVVPPVAGGLVDARGFLLGAMPTYGPQGCLIGSLLNWAYASSFPEAIPSVIGDWKGHYGMFPLLPHSFHQSTAHL